MRVFGSSDGEVSGRGAFARRVVASASTTGAARLWVAHAEMAPAAVSNAHHHGEAETVIYIVEGEAAFFIGPRLAQRVDARAGDFVWVEPGEVHVEINASATTPLRMIVVRSPADIAVPVEPPQGWRLPG